MRAPVATATKLVRLALISVALCLPSLSLAAADPNGLGGDFGVSLDNASKLTIPAGNIAAGTPLVAGQGDQVYLNMDQSDTLTLWGVLYFDRNLSLLAKVDGTYAAHYLFSVPPVASPKVPVAFDVLSLVLSGGFKDPFGPGSKLNFQVGRTSFRDFSGVVMNTSLDGLSVKAGTQAFAVSLDLGTSSLQSKAGSGIIISKADLIEKGQSPTYDSLVTQWASPRLIGQVKVDFNRLFLDQSLSVDLLGQLDSRPELGKFAHDYPDLLSTGRFGMMPVDGSKFDPTNANDKGAPVSMAYGGLDLSGKIVGPLYYDAWGYVGLGQTLMPAGALQYTPAQTRPDPVTHKPVTTPAVLQTYTTNNIINGIGSLTLNLLLPEAQHSVVNLSATLGSWDTDATGASVELNGTATSSDKKSLLVTDYTGWFGITRTGGQVIFNPQPVNMLNLQLAYSLKPFEGTGGTLMDNFSTALVATSFIRPYNGTTLDANGKASAKVSGSGAITESGVDPMSVENYMATEVDLNLAWRLSADLGLSLGAGLFLPNPAAMTRKTETKVQFSLSWGL